jgi:glycosyltransferase involved in cell wall biosynthesis
MSILEAMRSTDNDYSSVERSFFARTGQNLCRVTARESLLPCSDQTLSIVIAFYNGQHTLPTMLAAPQRQRYRNFEVVVVDDGSAQPLDGLVCESGLTVPITIIRSHQNHGLALARNAGVQCAQGDSIIFLDDDMLTPPEMTYALALRQTHISDCVFVGFREDVGADVFFAPREARARIERDWRYRSRGLGELLFLAADQAAQRTHRDEFSLVDDSSNFKKLGHCRVIGFWDLASAVAGHSICVKRSDAVAVGGFAEERFNGWGVEDLAFGALLAANRKFIIPALEWTSFHLQHEGRHVTRAEEKHQMKRNFNRHLAYIQEPVVNQRFPHHHLRIVQSAPGIKSYELC